MWTSHLKVCLVYLKFPVLKGFWVNTKYGIRCEINKSLGSFRRIFFRKVWKIPYCFLAVLQMMDKQPYTWLPCLGYVIVHSASYLQWRVHLVQIRENCFASWFLSLQELYVRSEASMLPGTKYKAVTLLKCCKRPQKPRNPSLQSMIQLSSALGLKSGFPSPGPKSHLLTGKFFSLPWKELLCTGNIDLMMINIPCFPEKENGTMCQLMEILISLEDISCGAESLLESGKKGSVYQPPQTLASNSYCASTSLCNGIAVSVMIIVKSEPLLVIRAHMKSFVVFCKNFATHCITIITEHKWWHHRF